MESAMLGRQLRALVQIALLWAVPWFALGALLGARHVVFFHGPVLLIPLIGVGCAINGVLIALAFGVTVLVLGRVRRLDRIAIGVSTVLTSAVGFLLGARSEPGYVSAMLFAFFAAACAWRALLGMRRSASELSS